MRPGVAAVAAREVAWIRHDIVAFLLVLVVPLLTFALLAGTFSDAVIRGLRIDVVDADRSTASSDIIQAINAAPGVEVARRSSDLTAAMHAIRSGAAIAAVFIPEGFERDLAAGKRPQLIDFFNKQLFTPGNIASSAIQAAVGSAEAALPRSASPGFVPGALQLEQYVLSNPALNYVQFLLRALMPTVLHVVIALTGAFAVGSEFGRRRDPKALLQAAGNSPLAALIGKLAPYFAVFVLMMVLDLAIIHGLFKIPFRGDALLVGASACLLIIAYLSLGALAVLLVRSLAVGLTLAGIFCSPAFGFAGVGFPVLAMGGFARAWGAILPLRWYIQILFDQAARGVAPRESLPAFGVLAGLAFGLFGLAWLRAKAVLRRPRSLPAPPSPEPPERLTLARAFRTEYRSVLRDSGAFGMIVLGPLLYAALYPQPYAGQLLRNVPIAVVDDDNSELSRTIIQTLGAHEALDVAARPLNLFDAQAEIARREVFAVVSIPAGTEREVLRGRPARIPAFVDSAYFLVYNRALGGISDALTAVSADLQTQAARPDGSLYQAALARSVPLDFLSEPLFNPTGGYGAYVVPAALVLILQQSLLMGVATLGGVAYERRATWSRGRVAAVFGQALAHLALALPSCALDLIILPHVYGYASSQRILPLLALAIPFILAVSLFGQFVGLLAKRRETAVILLMAMGMPLFFLVGVAWPPEAIPPIVQLASSAIPSTFGIDGLLRLNQMGASLADVSHDWDRLWLLVAVYAFSTCLLGRLRRPTEIAA